MIRKIGLVFTVLTVSACSNKFKDNGQEPGDTATPAVNPLKVDDDGDGYTEDQGDCDDTAPEVFPGAEEVVYDGFDNDCDSKTPDDDLDGDGYDLADDCDDEDKKINPGMDEEVYNGTDDDCDESSLDDDLDQDGFGIEDDCDDDDNDISPAADEITDNEIDDDCDGAIDERFDIEEIDASCDCGASSAIDVDYRGYAHVVYADADNGTVLYKMRNTSGTWTESKVIVDEPGWAGESLAIALDGYSRPHVAFTQLAEDQVTRGLYYITADSHGEWSAITPVDDGLNNPAPAEGEEGIATDVGTYVNIKVTTTNAPVFAYMDNNRGVPVVAVFTQSGTETLDQDFNLTGPTGQDVSMVLDAKDSIHTLYHNDGFMNDVRYTHWDSMSISEVASTREGFYTSLAIIEDAPCMSFYDYYYQDLMYGCRNESGNWENELILNEGNVGVYSTLLVNNEDVPNVLYYDGNSDSLRMLNKPTIGSWKQVEVDTGAGTGQYISAVTGPESDLYMTYYDQGSGALKFAVGQ